MHTKAQMRAVLRESRNAFSVDDRIRADAAICRRLQEFLRDRGVQRVAAYVPEEGEPGGTELLNILTEFEVWLPVCLPGSVLHWGVYEGPESLSAGRYGTPEPQPTKDSLAAIGVDVVVVPAMGARPDGVRIGRGAGFYDRALESTQAETVVLLYVNEVRDNIPAEPHDAIMDAIITPERTHHTK